MSVSPYIAAAAKRAGIRYESNVIPFVPAAQSPDALRFARTRKNDGYELERSDPPFESLSRKIGILLSGLIIIAAFVVLWDMGRFFR